MAGGSIIIPILISTEETTISTTKNGKNSKNPISKAVFISLIIKAGIITVSGISSTVLGFGRCFILKNSARSFSLVFLIIKFLNGVTDLVNASSYPIRSSIYGFIPSSYDFLPTGSMIKNVSTIAKETST